jgi:DNA-binding transcriptional ArsR family regulator
MMTSATTRLDDTLLGLADPTRRAIMAKLADADARVTDIAAHFPISLNSVSKHIRMLERAGLIRRRVEGREHFLSLDVAPLDEAAQWIEEHRKLWKHRLQLLDTLLREEDRARRKPRALPKKGRR